MPEKHIDSGWFKSTYSGAANDACVECRIAGKHVGVRDSKNPCGDALWFTPIAWRAFLGATGG